VAKRCLPYLSVVCLHTRFHALPPLRTAQHLPLYRVRIIFAQSFVLRRFEPVPPFVLPARRLFERACRTGAGARTPSTHARLCSNSPPVVVCAIHRGRAKALPWITEDLSRQARHGCIFYLPRCEILSGILWRSVYIVIVLLSIIYLRKIYKQNENAKQ
jgi:hypothetical protein